jgi:transposase InsO family protein
MPWKVVNVSELRLAFIQQVRALGVPVSRACEEFGISRKTGYKWLKRHREQPAVALSDLPRRPQRSPSRTVDDLERRVLDVRAEFGWGARKIHAYLTARKIALPSRRTVHQILRRHGCIVERAKEPAVAPQFFERSAPNQLWQCDHKGPLEVGRQRVHPLTVIDDHSRYLFPLRACLDVGMKTAFSVLWDVFGEFGLPESMLNDNAFGTNYQVPKTLSWFDSQLILLHIQPLHGRPYHPQTQGKVERLNGTLEAEVWPHVRRDSVEHFEQDVNRWRSEVYNLVRPHEALGDRPPLTRFRPSPRQRPPRMPEAQYETGAVLRKVSSSGDVSWKGYRILAGAGLTGQWVRVEDRGHELALFYCWKEIRKLAAQEMHRHNLL